MAKKKTGPKKPGGHPTGHGQAKAVCGTGTHGQAKAVCGSGKHKKPSKKR